jgi:hypothetical protein
VKAAAILPSRNEPATIGAVTAAVDEALGGGAVIIHADSSDTPLTAAAFTAARTRAAKIPLSGLPRGKGAQVLAAARQAEAAGADVVLIADTDTRNPDPAVYRALLRAALDSTGLAIADYPRHWDEANLTSHLARPLIAAATGLDVPQPLAGDLALPGETLAAAARARAALPGGLAECAGGYGIDVFLLLTAAARGPVTSVWFPQPKLHAGSFPHLPAIYRQAVPVLLHLTARHSPGGAALPPAPAVYRAGDRLLAPQRLQEMLGVLDALVPPPGRYDEGPWPEPVAGAWRAVRSGTPAAEAAGRLWPHYVSRVRDWLTSGQGTAPGQRAAVLAAAHARLHAALTCDGAP